MKTTGIFALLLLCVMTTFCQNKKTSAVKKTTTVSNTRQLLTRGEFVLQFNTALSEVKKIMDSLKFDTSLINTYDRNRSYITAVSEVRDIKPGSIYYNAVQSLIERWGIAAMFKKDKKLNAAGTVTEAEVYDILHVTMGYENAAVSKRAVALRKDAFNAMLGEAKSQIIQRILTLPKPQPDVFKDTIYIQQPYKKDSGRVTR